MERLGELGPLGSRFGSRTIGVDVDRGALKAVQVSSGGGAYTLQHVGYHRLPPGAVVEGEVADVVLLGAEIKAFWESHSFKSRSVVLGVANQKVVVRTLNMPRMEPEDLAGAIGYEAREHIPMPLEEAVLDHAVLGPDLQSPEEDRVLVVAAQRKMIGRFAAAARAGGLRPVGIDVKALSLTRSTLPEAFFADEDAVLLLDVGTELTSLTITQGRAPVLTRLLPTGLEAFVAAVEETADLDAEEAERHALNPRSRLGYDAERFEGTAPGGETAEDELDPVLVYDVRRGLEAAAQDLAEEVRRSVEYHRSRPEARDVAKAFVSGEGALVPGIAVYLGELLGLEARQGNPAARLGANKSNVSDEQLRAMEPVLAVAFGLALEDD